jgi:hypothetical protein
MRIKDNSGQALVITVVSMAVMLGMAAIAIDVGSWYKQKRDLQATADAAALAGAQALPSTSSAQVLAAQYATSNGQTLDPANVTFTSQLTANDTINVRISTTASGFFSRVFGIDTVTVGARASARSDTISEARYAAPIGVQISHPLLSGAGCPCFGQPTALTLNLVGPGGFKLLNLDSSHGGTSPGTLADWMRYGLDAWMPLGDYYSDPGARFNSSAMQDALDASIGRELLFPVYDRIDGQGANLTYHVIGWVGFTMTGWDARGDSGSLYGSFTRVIWQGLQGATGSSADLGAHSIQLVN